MKIIRVVAAVIKTANELGEPIISATQRGYGDIKGEWEFLGEKIEYDYPNFHLSMDCFWREVLSGNLVLNEHEAAKWLTKMELDSVNWLPADITLIETIKEEM